MYFSNKEKNDNVELNMFSFHHTYAEKNDD